MTTTDTWWETIFEGNLSLGLNKERISDLNDENFLFFDDRFEQENEHTHS
ncbi:hypothetical protein QTL97_03060 [Sporosarcina thermotolerans]|uniref:Uncharacterized protein n=1 Tax=Sporosarcina thermotolerans TaxID=633404 RepID=A0AAW9A4F7_9BACL|nr:hypothetical protein [Sporosarcina thermotolerans]MDW0115922.1 hypothetical protein [Sporosarcina thermotolerans]WHT46861.1 hypothetical protein QNH10_10785 [Sporosarcina thermotolerans]